jgi:hypothetical protein
MRRAFVVMLAVLLAGGAVGLGTPPARTLAEPSAQDPYDLCALIPTAQEGDANDANTVVGTWEDWQAEFQSTDPVPPELTGARLCYESSDTVGVMVIAVADTATAQRVLTEGDPTNPQANRPLDGLGESAVEYLPYSAGESGDDGFTIYVHTIVFVRGCYLVWGIDDLAEEVEPPPDSELRQTLAAVDEGLRQRPNCPEGVLTQASPVAQPSPFPADDLCALMPPEFEVLPGNTDPANQIAGRTAYCVAHAPGDERLWIGIDQWVSPDTARSWLATESDDVWSRAPVDHGDDGVELRVAGVPEDTTPYYGIEFVWGCYYVTGAVDRRADVGGTDGVVSSSDRDALRAAIEFVDARLARLPRCGAAGSVEEATPSPDTSTPEGALPATRTPSPTATDTPVASRPPAQQSKFPNPEPAPAGGMSLQAGQRLVVAGELVWVPIWLIDADGVANINFEIVYDPAVAMPEGELFRGNVLGNHAFSANTAERGSVLGGFAGSSNLRGTGTVAWIPYRAVGQPGDRTTLTVNVTAINSADGTTLSINRIDGEVLVVDETGLVPGDCDGDTLLNEVDALCALQMSVRRLPEQRALDLDGSGTVDSRDAVLILQRALGET